MNKLNNQTYKEVGTFEVKSNRLVVSDPCYTLGTRCMGELKNPRKGKWTACIKLSDEKYWGSRVAELIATYHDANLDFETWVQCDFEVGVDSGQAGIFSEYPDEPDDNTEGTWYYDCCKLTNPAGVLLGGAVSSSGFGDGVYTAYKIEKDGEVVAVKIVFIEDETDKCTCII